MSEQRSNERGTSSSHFLGEPTSSERQKAHHVSINLEIINQKSSGTAL
jgi:hypothetical protein